MADTVTLVVGILFFGIVVWVMFAQNGTYDRSTIFRAVAVHTVCVSTPEEGEREAEQNNGSKFVH